MPTLRDLQAAADQANAALADALRSLEGARIEMLSAAEAHYLAIQALAQPPAEGAQADTVADTAAIDDASARLDQTRTAYEQLRTNLGLV